MIEHEHPEIVVEDPDENERIFTAKAKAYNLELLKEKEQIVPPCVMYQREG
jgi:hypothetical protein